MKFIEVTQITEFGKNGEDFKSCLITLNVDSIREFFSQNKKLTIGGKSYDADITFLRIRDSELDNVNNFNAGDWYVIAEPYDSFFQRLIIDEDIIAPKLATIVSLWE